jgi:hypothetical protein
MRKRAYLYGRQMIWPQVAARYMESFIRARAERHQFALPASRSGPSISVRPSCRR